MQYIHIYIYIDPCCYFIQSIMQSVAILYPVNLPSKCFPHLNRCVLPVLVLKCWCKWSFSNWLDYCDESLITQETNYMYILYTTHYTHCNLKLVHTTTTLKNKYVCTVFVSDVLLELHTFTINYKALEFIVPKTLQAVYNSSSVGTYHGYRLWVLVVISTQSSCQNNVTHCYTVRLWSFVFIGFICWHSLFFKEVWLALHYPLAVTLLICTHLIVCLGNTCMFYSLK